MSNPFRPPGPIVITTHVSTPFADMEFAAPVGRQVHLVTTITVVIVAAVVLAALGFTLARPSGAMPPGLLFLAALIAAGATVLIAWFSQICRYRLTRDELLVERRNRHTRFALAGLTDATVDPAAMAWSLKVAGNDGVGAITGWYWNKRLGRFRALVTDRRRAVVLRWPGRCLVVSPERPEEFVREVRRRTTPAGLNHG